MSPERPEAVGERVLVLAPTGRDAALTCEVLRDAGLLARPCTGIGDLCREVETGAGAAVIASEAIGSTATAALVDVLSRQPTWSDLPVLVFTRGADDTEAIMADLGAAGNLTVLERPVRVTTIVSAVSTALRARRRQYEVRDLLARLEMADRRKDQFLAMLGHELRNPLAAVHNAIHILAHGGADLDRAQRAHAVIERQTEHLSRIIDDLLDVSRITLGKVTLRPRAVDLNEIAARVVAGLRSTTDSQQQCLTLERACEPLVVDGDPVRLEQVLANLLSNAAKYTPRGGAITVSLAAELGDAVLRVRDTGIGLAPETQGTIFELFAQLDESLDRSRGGLGLGLTLVRGLVELHGGSVGVYSDGVGRGSEFTIRLPLCEPSHTAEFKGQGEPVAVGCRPCRVLIVEDIADARESLRDLLELFGHEVETASDGPEGMQKLLARRPDVALIDIGLPGLDGYAIATRARDELGPTGMRLIALTGYGQPDDKRRALAAGFDAHIVKPVEPESLMALVGGCSGGKASASPDLP